MNHEPRKVAVTESYPTFWNDAPHPPANPPAAPKEAYSEFVNLTEDESPHTNPDDADADGD